MTREDITDGWWDVPEGLTNWVCPSCGVSSPTEDWRAGDINCEDCGDHDGRFCPNCGEGFDHVWGAEKIGEANEQTISR